jgi:helix-turn-helix protein
VDGSTQFSSKTTWWAQGGRNTTQIEAPLTLRLFASSPRIGLMTPAPEPAPVEQSPTMTRAEACARLGKSARTVSLYVSEGRLPAKYISGSRGREAVFERAEVDRLKAELEQPVSAGRVVDDPAGSNDTAANGSTALARRSPLAGDPFQHFLAAVLQANPVRREKPFLTLQEAVELTGAPAGYLVSEARKGAPFAISFGGGMKRTRIANLRFLREELWKAIEALRG